MLELLEQLGINWSLLVSQIVNFFILLIVLTLFVYKPLIKIIKERNAKIQEGLDKAKEADVRLSEIDTIGRQHLRDAEVKAVAMIKATEDKAKVIDRDLQVRMEKKQQEMDKALQDQALKQQEEIKAKIMQSAMEIVKKTVAKTVELSPDAVDEALIKKAVLELQDEK